MTRTPAIAVRNEIRQLINLHIEVFGRPMNKMLGQELDRIGLHTIPRENLTRAS